MYNSSTYCCNSCRKNPIFYNFLLKKKFKNFFLFKKIKKSKLVNFRFQLDRKLGFRVRAKNCKIEKAGRTLPTGVLLPAYQGAQIVVFLLWRDRKQKDVVCLAARRQLDAHPVWDKYLQGQEGSRHLFSAHSDIYFQQSSTYFLNFAVFGSNSKTELPIKLKSKIGQF